MAQPLLSDLYLFFNPQGAVLSQLTGNVLYNGTNKTGGSGNASYSLVANETTSQALLDVWNEFHTVYGITTTNTTNIATNTSSISTINTTLAALTTSMLAYNGGTLSELSISTNTALNTVWTAVNTKFIAVDAAIADITTGVSNATLYQYINDIVNNFVKSGLGVTSTTGFNLVLASGVSYITGQRVAYTSGTTVLTATKDNYIYLKNDGTITKQTVTVGASAPSTPSNNIVLFKFTTDGSGVTATVDLRNLYEINGTQIADGSIITRHLAALSVDTGNLTAAVTSLLLPNTATAGHTICWNGSAWVESTSVSISSGNFGVGVSSPTNKLEVNGYIKVGTGGTDAAGAIRYSSSNIQRYNGSAWNTLATNITELSDTTISSPASGDRLAYNGSAWVNTKSRTVSTKTADYVILLTDDIILVNKSSAAAITLPNAALCSGQCFTVSDKSNNADGNNITITPLVGTVNAAANIVISTKLGSYTFCNDGINWFAIAKV